MTTTKTDYLSRQTQFLESLHRRIKDDSGAKAALRRALSDEKHHIRSTYSIVLPLLPDIKYQQENWIFVACLSVYYPQTLNREHPQNFGYSCRGLANATNSEGAERRFRALLDTAVEDLRSPLTALVRQIKSKDIRLDYPQLLSDLCRWDYPDPYIQVQDRWARTFWGVSNTDEDPATASLANESSEPLSN